MCKIESNIKGFGRFFLVFFIAMSTVGKVSLSSARSIEHSIFEQNQNESHHEKHEHKHRRSPAEPEHSHQHSHQGITHCGESQFGFVSADQITFSPVVEQAFGVYGNALILEEFHSRVFRPPIS